MSEPPDKNKGVAVEDIGKERQKAGIHFLRSLLGDTDVASETANVAFWLHARSKSVRMMLMFRKRGCIRTKLLKCPPGAQRRGLCRKRPDSCLT